MEKFINKNIVENINTFDEILYIDESFDILKRNFIVGGKKAVMYYINGFCDNDLIQKVQEFFTGIEPSDLNVPVEDFADNKIPFIQIDLYDDKYNVLTLLLSGVVCLLIDGYDKAMLIDVRKYPARNVHGMALWKH